MTIVALLSPDEALQRLLMVPMIVSGIALLLAILIANWRRNMAMNDPEKYKRFRAWEEDERERQKKAFADTAHAGVKAAGVAVKVVRIILKK